MTFQPAPAGADLAARLAAFPFLAALAAGCRQLLEAAVVPHRLPAGVLLLNEGAACEALLLVERGAVRVFKTADTGREITLYQVLPGESCVLGTSCVLGGDGYPARAATDRPTDALAIPAKVFRELFAAEEPVRRFVMELFSCRLGSLMMLVDEVAFRRLDERLAAFLLAEAERAPGALAPVTLSHEQIACRLGTAREVVSRVLQQFAEEGLVQLERRRVEVLDAAALRARAAPLIARG